MSHPSIYKVNVCGHAAGAGWRSISGYSAGQRPVFECSCPQQTAVGIPGVISLNARVSLPDGQRHPRSPSSLHAATLGAKSTTITASTQRELKHNPTLQWWTIIDYVQVAHPLGFNTISCFDVTYTQCWIPLGRARDSRGTYVDQRSQRNVGRVEDNLDPSHPPDR